MKILDEIISTLNLDAPVRDIRQGVFHTGVFTRFCGLAATLPMDVLRQSPPHVEGPGFLLDKTAAELARLAYSESLLEAAIGVATINSLLEVDEASCVEVNAADVILEKGEGKRVAIVGHFPFVPRIRDRVQQLWVLEKHPRQGDYAEADADRLIPQADVVGITGTSLTNHTLDHLLALCARDAYVLMLGDTVPMCPLLFDHGVDALSGTRVQDAELALRCVSQGATFRQIKGVRRLTLFRDR